MKFPLLILFLSLEVFTTLLNTRRGEQSIPSLVYMDSPLPSWPTALDYITLCCSPKVFGAVAATNPHRPAHHHPTRKRKGVSLIVFFLFPQKSLRTRGYKRQWLISHHTWMYLGCIWYQKKRFSSSSSVRLLAVGRLYCGRGSRRWLDRRIRTPLSLSRISLSRELYWIFAPCVCNQRAPVGRDQWAARASPPPPPPSPLQQPLLSNSIRCKIPRKAASALQSISSRQKQQKQLPPLLDLISPSNIQTASSFLLVFGHQQAAVDSCWLFNSSSEKIDFFFFLISGLHYQRDGWGRSSRSDSLLRISCDVGSV